MRISYGLVIHTISFSLFKIRGIIPGDIFIFFQLRKLHGTLLSTTKASFNYSKQFCSVNIL